jgi:hypothetical protein
MLCLILFVASLGKRQWPRSEAQPAGRSRADDLGKLATLVSQLAWSPDGNGAAADADGGQAWRRKDTFTSSSAEGGSFSKVGAPPDWAGAALDVEVGRDGAR